MAINSNGSSSPAKATATQYAKQGHALRSAGEKCSPIISTADDLSMPTTGETTPPSSRSTSTTNIKAPAKLSNCPSEASKVSLAEFFAAAVDDASSNANASSSSAINRKRNREAIINGDVLFDDDSDEEGGDGGSSLAADNRSHDVDNSKKDDGDDDGDDASPLLTPKHIGSSNDDSLEGDHDAGWADRVWRKWLLILIVLACSSLILNFYPRVAVVDLPISDKTDGEATKSGNLYDIQADLDPLIDEFDIVEVSEFEDKDILNCESLSLKPFIYKFFTLLTLLLICLSQCKHWLKYHHCSGFGTCLPCMPW